MGTATDPEGVGAPVVPSEMDARLPYIDGVRVRTHIIGKKGPINLTYAGMGPLN